MGRSYAIWADPAGIALILYSIATVALIVERFIAWRRALKKSKAMVGEVESLLTTPDRQRFKDAFAASDAPLAQVMSYVLKHDTSESPETTLLLLDDALGMVGKIYRKNLVYIAAISGTAPFVGLAGTVLGVMHTFASIMKSGFGGPAVISAGIAQALQTTFGGLIVAIPAFIAYQLYNNIANEATHELRRQSDRIFVALGDL